MEDDHRAQATIEALVRKSSRRAEPADIARELKELGQGPAAKPRHPDRRVNFLANILDNHGDARGVENRSGAVACIGDYVAQRFGQRKVVASKDARLAALPWREAGVLPRFGVVESGDKVSVSYARRAIAETGSIILESGRDSPVSNSLLAENHIVLVDAADVFDRLEDAWHSKPRGADAYRPRCLQIISGPSSTADIALNMVYSAQGPNAWLVILIAADGPELAREAQDVAAVRAQPGARS